MSHPALKFGLKLLLQGRTHNFPSKYLVRSA